MTLLAAFRTHDIPVLIGDFLLTTGGQRSGLRRKIHRIGPNFVIGWTGQLVAATNVLTPLHAHFEGRRVTRSQVESFLAKYPAESLGSMQVLLSGWIMDSEPCCFLWNSTYPSELFQSDHYYLGSGAPLFEKLAGPGNITSNEANNHEQPPLASSVLSLTCALMSDEMLLGENQAAGFGHAYEILYWDGDAFKYIDRILYGMTLVSVTLFL